MLETSGESVLDGEKNQCMGARKHETRINTGIERVIADLRYFGHVE